MQDIRMLLDETFPDARHPGNSRLLRNDAIDDTDVSFLYAAEALPWHALSPELLDRESSCLTALSDEGLRYVLPAYIFMFANNCKDSFGWTDRLLNVLRTRGRGNLYISNDQFGLIDQLVLKKAALIGGEYNTSGSTLGVSFEQLVHAIRKSN